MCVCVCRTQVVVDELGGEGGLLVPAAPVGGGAGIGGIHGEDVRRDAHQLRLAHQLPDGRGAGGQGSRKLLPGNPRLRTGVTRQLGAHAVLMQTRGDAALYAHTHTHTHTTRPAFRSPSPFFAPWPGPHQYSVLIEPCSDTVQFYQGPLYSLAMWSLH